MVLRNFQIPHKDIKIKVNNNPKLRKSKVDADQKISKLVDLCSSVDSLAINLEVAIENYERLAQLKTFNYNDEGPQLIALIMKAFLKQVNNCFASRDEKDYCQCRYQILHSKPLKSLAKSIAESSVAEAILTVQEFLALIEKLTEAESLTLTTFEVASVMAPDDDYLSGQLAFAK